ncbi:MAG TPA: DNA-binding protein [Allosphingosinicella sp.]|jgi:predicted DNA-binding transcriptional regulator AlpA|uniref:helix-turn-helix transcriptional regulator n=1 Tax=Allosphingosinicella sp. TaxID=2823234 RepID=UPI002F2A02D5
MTEDRWVDTEGAAKHVGLAVSTMEKLRTYGDGCRYSKRGRSVRYRISDLDAWMTERLVQSTSERLVA